MMSFDNRKQKCLLYVPFVGFPLSGQAPSETQSWQLLLSFWDLSASMWTFKWGDTASKMVLITGPLCYILIATVLVMALPSVADTVAKVPISPLCHLCFDLIISLCSLKE